MVSFVELGTFDVGAATACGLLSVWNRSFLVLLLTCGLLVRPCLALETSSVPGFRLFVYTIGVGF